MLIVFVARAVPLRYPADVDSRRFPGLLKLNLGVRTGRYARFAAIAKNVEECLERARRRTQLRGPALQLANQTGKFETIN
jgi:hypothetical protein